MQITYTSYKKDNSVYISIYLHGTTTQIGNFEVAKIDENFDRLADGNFLKIGDNVLNETVFKQCLVCDKNKLMPNHKSCICGNCLDKLINIGAYAMFNGIEFIVSKENLKLAKQLIMV